MKLKKILNRLIKFFDEDAQKQKQDLDALRKLLKELKQTQKKLCADIEETVEEGARQKIQDKLDVIKAQRLKGKELLMSFRESKKSKKV